MDKKLFNEIMSHLCRAEAHLFSYVELEKDQNYEEIRKLLDEVIDKMHELDSKE